MANGCFWQAELQPERVFAVVLKFFLVMAGYPLELRRRGDLLNLVEQDALFEPDVTLQQFFQAAQRTLNIPLRVKQTGNSAMLRDRFLHERMRFTQNGKEVPLFFSKMRLHVVFEKPVGILLYAIHCHAFGKSRPDFPT